MEFELDSIIRIHSTQNEPIEEKIALTADRLMAMPLLDIGFFNSTIVSLLLPAHSKVDAPNARCASTSDLNYKQTRRRLVTLARAGPST